MYAFCLSCPSATFAHQYGGFVPREWLPAKGLLSGIILTRTMTMMMVMMVTMTMMMMMMLINDDIKSEITDIFLPPKFSAGPFLFAERDLLFGAIC